MQNKLLKRVTSFIKSVGVAFLLLMTVHLSAQVSFTNGGLTYSNDFNTLATSGTSGTVPSSWAFSESGTNANIVYTAGSGSSSTGDTYSFGTGTTTERALGEISSGSLISVFGVQFQNNSTQGIVQLNISYVAELWRKGVTSVKDSMIFEYSYDATSLTTGTWTGYNTLNLYTPNLSAVAGSVNGDLAANRAVTSQPLTGVTLGTGNTMWIRWRAVNISGNDDGLGLDDFSVTAVNGVVIPPPANISFQANEQTVNESAGTISVQVNISNSNANQSEVTVAASVFSNATGGGTDYTITNPTLIFPALSSSSQNVNITINDDAILESAEYIVLRFSNLINANEVNITQHTIYIKDNDRTPPVSSNHLSWNLVSSFSNGTSGTNSAEIVKYDTASKKLFIVNSIGAKLDIVDFSTPATPVLSNSISITPYGNINSLDVKNGIVACAVEDGANPQAAGKIVFFDINGTFLNQVVAGAMPDMITFNHAGTKVLSANEGEPNATYTSDPEGSITVVDISGGIAGLTAANVTQINFNAFDSQISTLRSAGVRIYGLNATVSQDLEPEYITVEENDATAWVTLQENNALAKVNLVTNTVTDIIPLGTKNHNLVNNGMDISDVTSGVNISNFPLKGMYLPDAIASCSVNGTTFLLTANEGDARAYTAFNEETTVSAASFDPTVFPNAAEMKNNYVMGKIKITNRSGDIDNDGDLDELYSYGSRSFSIWNATTGAQVYDSGDDFEQITANDPFFSQMFNASNGATISVKNRSDDKGPEPEGVVTGEINGNLYAFVALERIGGVMTYNINNPLEPEFTGYNNNRNLTGGPDRGAEGIIFIPSSESPDGNNYVILANEVSSTLSIYSVGNCASTPLVSGDTICGTGVLTLTASGAGTNEDYKWYDAATGGNLLQTNGSGYTTVSLSDTADFYVSIYNSVLMCESDRVLVRAFVNPIPSLTAASNSPLCSGYTLTFSSSTGSAGTYTWTGPNSFSSNLQNPAGITNASPSMSGTYSVNFDGGYAGCTASSNLSVLVGNFQLSVTPDVVNNTIAHAVVSNCDPDYTIYWKRVVAGSVWSNTTSTLNTKDITGLLPATAYIAYAEDENGATSELVYFTTSGVPVCGTAPTGLTASVNCNQISLNWNTSGYTSFTSYIRQITPAPGASNGKVTTTNSRTFTVPVSAYGQQFEISVAGKCGTQYSVYANPILISVADPRPAQVSPAFSNITCNSMTVSWSPVAGATSYRVRIKNPLTNSMFVNTVVTNTTYTKTGFTQNFTYEVWVTPIGCNNIAGFESQHFDVQICTGNVNPTGGATRIQQTAEEQDDMISFDNLPDFGEETLNIYPNPSSDKINITLNNSHSTQVMLNISDMTGRNIIRQSFSVTDGNLNEILDISTLPSGVYYVTITDKSIITRKKIVKE